MAGRLSDAMQLVRRAEAAGWRVENGSRGVKVYNHEGTMFTIHKTYSDVRSFKNAEAQLLRLGLADDEKATEEQKAQRGKARIANGRAASDKLAAEMVERARAVSVAKAAGPYLVEAEDVGVMWFAEPHPAPWMRWVAMTAELATYLLDNHNKPGGSGVPGTNRPLDEKQIEFYRDVILSGQWHLTHQGMAMDTNAVLQDGQHRLGAIVAAEQAVDLILSGDMEFPPALLPTVEAFRAQGGVQVPVAFFVGMNPDNFKAIDEGKLRTASQLFSRAGEKNASTLQSMIRLLIAYRNGNARSVWQKKTTNLQIMNEFGGVAEQLRAAASFGQSNYKKIYTAPSPLAAAWYLIREANGDGNRFVDAFFGGLLSGAKTNRMLLDDTDPRAVFRKAMQDARIKGELIRGLDQMGMLIQTWNNLTVGHHPRTLRWSKATAIPKVNILLDDKPGTTGAPRALAGEIPMREDG
jgi:hypothetical protein